MYGYHTINTIPFIQQIQQVYRHGVSMSLCYYGRNWWVYVIMKGIDESMLLQKDMTIV